MPADKTIYASVLGVPPHTHAGSDPSTWHMTVICRVHAGLKAVKDRQVDLIMRKDEAFETAMGILGHLPVDYLLTEPQKKAVVEQFARMLDAAK